MSIAFAPRSIGTLKNPVITIFGSSGFMGNPIVSRLASQGFQIILPYRGEEYKWRHLKFLGSLGQINPIPFSIRDVSSIERAMKNSDIVINLIGRRWRTKNFSLNEANVISASLISKIAKQLGTVEKFFYLNPEAATGPDAPSDYLQSRYLAEQEIRSNFPEATVIKTTNIFGTNDHLLRSYGRMLHHWGWLPIFEDARPIQPIWCSDVTSFLTELVKADPRKKKLYEGKTFHLAGPETLTQRDLVLSLLKYLKADVPIIKYRTDSPPWRFYFETLFNVKPTLTIDDIKAMRSPNWALPEGTNDLDLFGINPSPITVAFPQFKLYRKPGDRDFLIEKDHTFGLPESSQRTALKLY